MSLKAWTNIDHSDRYSYPIFTLPVLSSRIYLVTSPVIAAHIQRASKSLSFNPIIVEMTRRMVGFSADTQKIVTQNMDKEEGKWGLMSETHEMTYSVLASTSPGFQDMIAKQVGKMNMLLNTEVRNGVMEVELFAWVRQKIAVATGYAFYGPENPLEMYPELKQAYWDFENGLVPLLVHILPSLTARKAYLGREKLASRRREEGTGTI